MKYYDYDKAKQLIEENKENLSSASLGMHEDWSWTADTIWSGGEYQKELLSNKEAEDMNAKYHEQRKAGMSMFDEKYKDYDACFVAGIRGSEWATPTLNLVFCDGSDKMIECSYGEQEVTDEERRANSALWASGALSGPCQKNITPLNK